MPHRNHDDVEINRAMGMAVASWAGMLVLLLILLGATVVLTWPMFDEIAEDPLADGWFVSAMALVAILPSLAAFAHRSIFHRNRTERGTVTPAGYLQASLTLWGAITICGVWATVGSLMAQTLIPHVIPLFIAMVLLLGTWPNGKAMVKPRSRESDDDTEILHIPPEDE